MRSKNKHIWLPLVLLGYLLVMAYMGRSMLHDVHELEYWSVFGISLLVIVLLHFTLKHKERLRRFREGDEKNDKC